MGHDETLAHTIEMSSCVSEVYARGCETNQDNRENPLGETQNVSQRRCTAVREVATYDQDVECETASTPNHYCAGSKKLKRLLKKRAGRRACCR